MIRNRWAKLAGLMVALGAGASAQLNQNCIVSVLNRNVQVNADGTWVLPNVPAGYGPVKARATCVQNGVTSSGESAFFTVTANGAQNLPAITLGSSTPIPTSLSIIAPGTPLTIAGQTLQLAVTATYPDNTTQDVTVAAAGTAYTSSNPAIATVSAGGLLTAVSTGKATIQATNDGASGIASFQVALGGVSHNGIPDSWALANGLNPLDPTLALEDPDRDGLTNLQEFQLGTNPTNPDTDGDGLRDGDEVNLYHTNPLLADTDGDLIPDGVEITTGTDPLNATSYDLKKAAASSVLQPPSFVLTTSVLVPNASVQLSWKVTLIDGKTTLDLTADPRTNYNSSDVTICNFGTPKGMVFAANTGSCVITITQSTLSMIATGTVQSFTPKTLSFVTIPGFANNVKVNGNYAYVAAGSAGLQVVDVTDRTNPLIVSSLALPSNANDLRIRGSTLYVATNSGLLTIDVTNPLSPKLLGSLSTPGVAWDVTLSGNLAYIADGASGLQIADISNAANPALVGSLAIAGGTAKGVDVAGTLAVVAAGTTGVVIVNIANPTAPQRLGVVATPGDAHKVAVKGTAAFVADYPQSMQVVDFTNPAAPAIIAATQDALGGKLQDVALATISGETFTVGADVFFVNGVPFVDVTQPNNPVPRLILDFKSFRDDNGHGIGLDPSYVYMTGEEGTISELGTTGNTRLYIGQYQQIVDNGGVPPAVQITSPAASPVIEGSPVTINVTATDDIAVASVQILVNGQVVLASSAPPFQYSFTAPTTPGTLSIVAKAVDYGNNTGTATLNVPVIPDPLTTVTGRVVDGTGLPLAEATVKLFSFTTTSGADGTFTFTGVPTVSGHIIVQASATVGNALLAGTSASLIPVGGGTTSTGDITVRPIPVISSVQPNYGLVAHATTVTVTGTQLTNATFDLPSGGVVSGVVINSDTQATIQITGTNLGNWALIATNPAGSSDTNLTSANQFLVLPAQGAAFVDLSVLNRGWIPADIPDPRINISGALSGRVAVVNQAWIPADIPDPRINISGALANPVAVLNQAWIPADIPNPRINVSGALSSPVAVLNQAWIPADIPSAGKIGFAASLVVSVNNTATGSTGLVQTGAVIPSALQTQSAAQASSRTVEILSPSESATLLAGQTVPIRVNLPDVTASGAEFSVNGAPWRATAPFEFLFTAPAGVSSVDLRAVVRATDGREWVTPLRHLLIVPDQGQTISGHVVSADGKPVPRAPVHILASGLAAEYFRFDQPLTGWPDLTGRAPDKQSYVSAVNQPNTSGVFGHDPFGTGFTGDYATRLTGRIRAQTPGNYIFYLQAHRGSRLLIDGRLLLEIPFVQNDPVETSTVALLSAGWHSIEVDHFESIGAPSLELSWQPPDSPREVVPQEAFQTDIDSSVATDAQGSFTAGPIPLSVAPLSVTTDSRGASVVIDGNLPMERVRQ